MVLLFTVGAAILAFVGAVIYKAAKILRSERGFFIDDVYFDDEDDDEEEEDYEDDDEEEEEEELIVGVSVSE
jgi:Ran GTPase-activating protein (RanGAP) involved in mRNA processing and transport